MEALIGAALTLVVLGIGLALGLQLGAAERSLLERDIADARRQLEGARSAVAVGHKIADALGSDDPRARVRGLLSAGAEPGPVSTGPEPGSGGA